MINLVFTFTIRGISVGGHVGGLIGGILSMLALLALRPRDARTAAPGFVGVAASSRVGVAQRRRRVPEGPRLRVSEYRPVPLEYERPPETTRSSARGSSSSRCRRALDPPLLDASRCRGSSSRTRSASPGRRRRARTSSRGRSSSSPIPETKRRLREGAEAEERDFYERRATHEWKEAIRPIGTDWVKTHITDAPYVIVVFEQPWRWEDGTKVKHYYVRESVGIAVGFLLAALQEAGLCALTHTPSPMRFLAEILERPENERPFILIPVGYPADDAEVPDLERKPLDEILVRGGMRRQPPAATYSARARRGERGLRGGEPRERHAERRARHVVEPELVAERDGLRLAAVLAADAELQVVLDAAAALDRDAHQVADARAVERLERVLLEHVVLQVVGEELPLGVVAREAERRLRQVVRPEGEEVRVLGDLVGAHARARQLDHRAAEVLDLALLRDRAHGQLAQPAQLLGEADERMHDLDERRLPGPLAHGDARRARSRAPASRRSPGT